MLLRSSDGELGILRTLVVAAFVLAIPVALITTTIRATISEQAIYDYSVREFDAADGSGIPERELLRANREIRDYLVTSSSASLAIAVVDENGEEVSLFNARETAHMIDVRDIVQFMLKLQMASVAIVLTLGVLMVAVWPTRVIAAGLVYGAALTGGLLVVAGALAASGFDSAWSQFHGIAFTNDLWQLDPDTDHLIQMFPEEFWFRVTSLIVIVIAGEALLVGALGAGLFVFTRGPQRRAATGQERPPLPGRAGHARTASPEHRLTR